MNKIKILSLVWLFLPLNLLVAQTSSKAMWAPIDINTQELGSQEKEAVSSVNAEYFEIDAQLIESLLEKVPTEYAESITLDIPVEDNQFVKVYVEAYDAMHPKLASKYPHIKTYRGHYNGSPVYVTLSPRGIDAYMSSKDGFYIIEPIASTTQTLYRRYTTSDIADLRSVLSCGLDDSDLDVDLEVLDVGASRRSSFATLRKYRLAMLATEAYSRSYGRDFERTFAAIVDLVNGMNAIYVNNMGIEFELIENNDEIIFTDIEEDPYGEDNLNGPKLLNDNTTVLYRLIGGDNFDIGHVMTGRCIEGGFAGVSRGSIACNNPIKGAGVTCEGLASSTLITTAHEFGHHFSAGHTWSNCPPQMGQYRSDTAVEPGSGFTILSYAGVCGDQNLNIPRVDFFHNKSLDQIISFSREGIGANCGEDIELEYELPVVKINTESGTYIPISTSFELDGSIEGVEEGATVLYNFEQMDLGPMSPVGEPEGNAPSFISQTLTDKAYREFPKRNYGLAHAFYKMEVLPAYSRDLTFRLTARDGRPGRAVWDEVQLHSTEEAGPFRITSQADREEYIAGQKILVEWDVANTDQAPINCDRVDVYYSTDNGLSFDYLLAENVKNDGSVEVFLPTKVTGTARLKVKASNNVFFDYNQRAFSVKAPEEPTFTVAYGPFFDKLCTPTLHEIEINTEALLDYEGEIELSFIDALPEDIVWEFDKNPITAGESTVLRLDMSTFRANGDFMYQIQAASEVDTLVLDFGFETTGNFYSNFAPASPAYNETNVAQAPLFVWEGDSDADLYFFELSTTPDFASILYDRELEKLQFQLPILLEKAKIYYWRVRPINKCGDGAWSDVQVFKTVQQECSTLKSGDLDLFISPQGKPTVKGPIEVDARGAAISVSVPKVKGEHNWVGYLSGTLQSPSGTEVVLWDRECGNGANFDMGFDDGSPLEVTCPINSGRIYKPKESLSNLIGEEVRGQWNLVIKAHESGEFGVFKNWSLEVCFESDEVAPSYYRNDTLRVQHNNERSLSTAIRYSHTQFNPWEITFSMISLPEHGTLSRVEGGEYTEINLLETFTMQEVYDNKIVLVHNGGQETYDAFKYYASTPDGGWTGAETLPIRYQDEVSSTSSIAVDENLMKVWPSPAKDYINVQLDGKPSQGEWQLIDMYGNTVQSMEVDNSAIRATMSLDNCSSGMYILRWHTADYTTSSKVLIQK